MYLREARKVGKSTLLGLFLFLIGCLQQGSGGDSGTEVIFAPPLNTLVCDPFAEEHSLYERHQGVKAQMYYKPADAEGHWNNLSYYFEQGTHIEDVDIYLSQIFIPTRPFDRGFYTQAGDLLKNESGNSLYEWFALDIEGFITLGEQPAGKYQLALLSDDGAVLNIQNKNGEWQQVINNDGNHPTKMMCATEPVELSSGSKIPFQLKYYQGPRFHISLMVMWRPWPENDDPSENYCGASGNSLFFDSTQNPPEPQPAFYALESRGWRVLSPDQYEIPDSVPSNPCNQEPVVISGLTVQNISSSSITLAWNTDAPSTSQIKVKNMATGEIIAGDIDLALVESHSLTLSGLSPSTYYEARVYSSTTSGLVTESAPMQFYTRR